MYNFETGEVLKRIEIKIAERGMTKEEFYNASGITSASFSQWRTGTHKPTKKKLACAAQALDVSLEYLLTGEDKKSPPPVVGSGNAKIDEIIRIASGLSSEDVEKLIAYAEGMRDAGRNN